MSHEDELRKLKELEVRNENRITNGNTIDKNNTTYNDAFVRFGQTKTRDIVDRCEFFITSIENAYKHRNYIDDTWVNSYRDSLNIEVENLKENISNLLEIKDSIKGIIQIEDEKYALIMKETNSDAGNLVEMINYNIDLCENTFERANDALNENLSNILDENNGFVETPKDVTQEDIENALEDAPVVEPKLNPTEIKVDSLDELANEVDEDIAKYHENINDLQDARNELNNYNDVTPENYEVAVNSPAPESITNNSLDDEPVRVTSYEEVPQNIIAPVLQPQEENQSLNDFLATAATGPEINQTNDKIIKEDDSAPNVDEGFVKVEKIEDFGAPTVEEQGPVLTRSM